MKQLRFARRVAIAVARDVCDWLRPACARLIVAGSLRRRRPDVGDIEILYIPLSEERQSDLFFTEEASLADERIEALEARGVLERRMNIIGREMYGPQNKLMRHCETGIPVDLFATTAEAWHNYLVCRTGPAASNTRIAVAARLRGWKWNPYGPGFTNLATGEVRPIGSEEGVFAFVGLPYHQPKERR